MTIIKRRLGTVMMKCVIFALDAVALFDYLSVTIKHLQLREISEYSTLKIRG